MILILFFFTSPLVIYSIFGIRLSRIFLIFLLIKEIYLKKSIKKEPFTLSKNFLKQVLIYFSIYTLYLLIITILYILFEDSSSYYLKNIIKDIGPRIEIILILFLGLNINFDNIKLSISAFIFGWFLNLLQTFNLILFSLDVVTNPLLASFLIDKNKYPIFSISEDRAFGFGVASQIENVASFTRSFGLVGEPSIFGIYGALCMVLIYFTPKSYLPLFIREIPRYVLVLLGIFTCLASMSKVSIILIFCFLSYVLFLPLARDLIKLKLSIQHISVITTLIIFIFSLFLSNISYFNIITSRLLASSGHLDHLLFTLNSSLDVNFLKLIFGAGLGINQSSHRFFITQFAEGGIFGLIFSLSIVILFINNIYKINRKIIYANKRNNLKIFTKVSVIISGLLIISFLIYDPSYQPILWTTFLAANLLFFHQEINYINSIDNFNKS